MSITVSPGDEFIQEYFGSVGRPRGFVHLPVASDRSMLTLFQATTTEGWADIARKVMEKQPWTAGFFILYLHVGLEEPLYWELRSRPSPF